MAAGDTRTEHFLDVLAHGSRADIPQENCCNTKTQNYILGAINRIIDVEEEVEWLENNPDVADIVATYAALQAYDTSSLTDKDIIRVLSDETHEGQSTYYRYDKSDDSWDFIGTIGDYYTKTQLDTILEGKQDVLTAGENISIVDESGSLVISATDTTYTAGTGIDIDNGVISATSSGPTVVQSTGTSTTDVMSQNATTSMVFADPSTKQRVQIGDDDTFAQADGAIAIGCNLTSAQAANAIAIGKRAQAQKQASLALGWKAIASANGSVALGTGAQASTVGQFDIGEANGVYGYNNSNYRLLTGLYDPQSAHDAATKGYIDARVLTNAGAPTTATVGAVGQLLEDTTNGKLYICTDATNPYVWEEAGTGGGAIYTAGEGIAITEESGEYVISATGGGGSGMVELTSADYDYPTNSPDGVALWLLSDGEYHNASGVKVYIEKNSGGTVESYITVMQYNELQKAIWQQSNSNITLCRTLVSNGNPVTDFPINVMKGAIAQSTGTSTTAVMSQNAVTSMVYKDPSTKYDIQLGAEAVTSGSGYCGVAIGYKSNATGVKAVAIGANTGSSQVHHSVALGSYSNPTQKGQVDISTLATTNTYGYNDSQYRLLTGLYDPQSAHDAANKQYVDPITDSSAPTTATVGRLGQIQIDTTNADAYMCVAVDSVTPSYIWKKISV